MLSGPRSLTLPHLCIGNNDQAKNIRNSAANCSKVVLIIRMGCRASHAWQEIETNDVMAEWGNPICPKAWWAPSQRAPRWDGKNVKNPRGIFSAQIFWPTSVRKFFFPPLALKKKKKQKEKMARVLTEMFKSEASGWNGLDVEQASASICGSHFLGLRHVLFTVDSSNNSFCTMATLLCEAVFPQVRKWACEHSNNNNNKKLKQNIVVMLWKIFFKDSCALKCIKTWRCSRFQ